MKSSHLIAYPCLTPADSVIFLFVCTLQDSNPQFPFVVSFLQNQCFLPGWTARQMILSAVQGRG